MTGYVLCQKYNALSGILNGTMEETNPSMAFINFDCMLTGILDQWHDIGYQSEHNKAKVVSDVVQFVCEVVSHYKQYFKDYDIILYHTDIESEPQLFKTAIPDGNEYMLNYVSRFNTIKYQAFKALYIDSLYSVINTVIDAVPCVHLIKVKNIDSAMVPLTFAKEYPNRKLVVVTWDNVDTLLSHLMPNVTVVYDARKTNGVSPVVSDGLKYIDTVTNAINPNHYGRFASHVLAAAVGNANRSLYGIGRRNGGYDVVAQWLQQVFGNSTIPVNYSDYSVISSQIRSNDTRKDFETSFLGMDLEMQYQLMRQEDRTEILYKMDHTPVDPNDIIKLFPNMVFEWDKLFS